MSHKYNNFKKIIIILKIIKIGEQILVFRNKSAYKKNFFQIESSIVKKKLKLLSV